MPTVNNSYTFCADYSAIADCLFAIQAMQEDGGFNHNPEILNLLNGLENDVLRKLYNITIRVLGVLEGVTVTPEYLLGDFEYLDFSELDFSTGLADSRNNGYSSRFQTILNIFAVFCSRSSELGTADIKSINAAVIPVIDTFRAIRSALSQAGFNPCTNYPKYFNNAPTLYLQAAGSDGTGGIPEGIHLRWSLTGDLGQNHLPRGDYRGTAAPAGYNKGNDYVTISRTPYVNPLQFQVELMSVAPAAIDLAAYRWTYLLNLVTDTAKITNFFRVSFLDTALYNQIAAATDPVADPSAFLEAYHGLIEITIDDKTAFSLGYDFRLQTGTGTGTLKLQLLSTSDGTETINIRKTVTASSADPVTGKILCDNLVKVQMLKSPGSFVQSLIFETYADFTGSRAAADWALVGSSFALSLEDQVVYDRLETTDYPIDNLWPQYRDGTLVKAANYRDKWLTSHPNDRSVKDAVQLYLTLSETDSRAMTVLKDDGAPEDAQGLTISMLDVLNLMALDYHWARMLGLGHIDTQPNGLAPVPYVYKISYSNHPDPGSSAVVIYEYLSLPTGRSDSRLPDTPVMRPLTYQLPVQNGANAGLFTEDGYSNYSNTRIINIGRQTHPYEALAGAFFTDPSAAEDFDTFGHTTPILYGIEYRPDTQSTYIKPPITDEKSVGFVYYAYDAGFPDTGVPETAPVPDNQTSLYLHFEKQPGVHAYAIYGINWFSRVSLLSNEQQTDATLFPAKNKLLPPTGLTVQYIQTEDPLVFTTATEQNWLYARQTEFPGEDTDFTRITFNWLDIVDISEVQDMSTFDYAAVIKPDRVKTWFKPGEPMQITGVVTGILPVAGQESQVLLLGGNYSLLDGSAVSPLIDAADLGRFTGSLLSTPEGQFIIRSVSLQAFGPAFLIEKVLEVSTVEDPDTAGFYGSADAFIQPAIGSRFTVAENLAQTPNWLPVVTEIQLIDYGNASDPVTEDSADSEGNITRNLIGGISGSAVVASLTDQGTQLVLPGYYSVTFDPAVILPPHPQDNLPFDPASPGSNSPGSLQTPFVDWYNGQARMPLQGSSEKKLLNVIRIVQTSPLTVYLFDADYQNNPIQLSDLDNPTVGLVNFHPGYKAYFYTEPLPDHAFNSSNILPAAGSSNRKSLVGLQTADTRPGGSGFASAVSPPAILMAQRITSPVQLPAPITYGLKVRPDATTRAAFTFDLKIAPDGSGAARTPFGFMFYRTTNEDILEALYTPDTVSLIISSLEELTIDEHFNQRYNELASLVFDPVNPGNFQVFDATPAPYGFPVPDKTGLTEPEDTLAIKAGKYRDAINATLLPLTNQTPIYALIRTGYQTENKLPTIRTIDGDLIDPSDPVFDPFPMIRKYSSTTEVNTGYVRFADYTLNGSSRFLYFFGAAEVTNKLVIGPMGGFAGPVSVLHTIPAEAPVLRYFTLSPSTGQSASPLTVNFYITPFSAEDTITKLRIYRTTDQSNTASLYTMDSYTDAVITIDPVNGILVEDDFADLAPIPVGEVIYYRLAFIRTISNEFDLSEEVVGIGSAPLAVTLIDTVNPQAPTLSYDASTGMLAWPPMANKATYFVYQQNATGNWSLIGQVNPGDPLTYKVGRLPALDNNGNQVYYRFKVRVQNASGLSNLTDEELTVSGAPLYERLFDGDPNATHDFTDFDSGFAYNNGKWTTVGGVGNQFKYLFLNALVSATDRYTSSLRFIKLDDADSAGVGMSVMSVYPNRSWISQASFVTIPSLNYYPGQSFIYSEDVDNGGALIVNEPSLPLKQVSAGDQFLLTMKLDKQQWIVQLINETTGEYGSPLTYNVSLNYPNNQQLIPCPHNFCIHNFFGTNQLISFKIDVNLPPLLDLALVGDTLFSGYFAESADNTIYQILQDAKPSLKIGFFGGSGSLIADLQTSAGETKAYLNGNSLVLIHAGGAELLAGMPPADVLTAMNALVNDLKSTGASVYILGPTPISISLTTQVAALHDLFSNKFGTQYIDVFTPLSLTGGDINPVYYTGSGQPAPWDGINLVPSGQALVASIIISRLTQVFNN